MTKNQIVEATGRNVYHIWLDVAMGRYVTGTTPKQAFDHADRFVEELLKRNAPGVPPNTKT